MGLYFISGSRNQGGFGQLSSSRGGSLFQYKPIVTIPVGWHGLEIGHFLQRSFFAQVGNVLVQIRAGVARPASAVGQECPDGMLLLSMSITRGTDAIDTMEQKNAGTAQVLGLLPGEGANVVLYRSGRSEHMTVGCSSSPSTKPNET